MSFEIKSRFAALTAMNMRHTVIMTSSHDVFCDIYSGHFASLEMMITFFLLLNKNSHPGSLESFTMNLNITD